MGLIKRIIKNVKNFLMEWLFRRLSGPAGAGISAGLAIGLGAATSLFANEFTRNYPICFIVSWFNSGGCDPFFTRQNGAVMVASIVFLYCCALYGYIKADDIVKLNKSEQEFRGMFEKLQTLPDENFLSDLSSNIEYATFVCDQTIREFEELNNQHESQENKQKKQKFVGDGHALVRVMLFNLAQLVKKYDGRVVGFEKSSAVYSANIMRPMDTKSIRDECFGKMFSREQLIQFESCLVLDKDLSASTSNLDVTKNEPDKDIYPLALPLPNNNDRYSGDCPLFLPGAPEVFLCGRAFAYSSVANLMNKVERCGLQRNLVAAALTYLSQRGNIRSFMSIPIFQVESYGSTSGSDSKKVIAVLNINSTIGGILRDGGEVEVHRFLLIVNPIVSIIGKILLMMDSLDE